MRVGFALGAAAVLALVTARGASVGMTTRLAKALLLCLPVLLAIFIIMPDRFLKATKLDRFAQANVYEAEGTAYWRVLWWQRLYEAVMKENPAFGIGFGESLHLYHPLLETLDDPLVARAPHNFHITVFTRMGFVGLAIWLFIAGVGIAGVFIRTWKGMTTRGKHYSPERRDELAFWVMMLVFTVVNSSFGVLMEGPVLGIWFWLALGFATGRAQSPGGTAVRTGLLNSARSLRLQLLATR